MLIIIIDQENGLTHPDKKIYDYCNKIVTDCCFGNKTGTYILGSEIYVSAIRLSMKKNKCNYNSVVFYGINNLEKPYLLNDLYSPMSFDFYEDVNVNFIMELLKKRLDLTTEEYIMNTQQIFTKIQYCTMCSCVVNYGTSCESCGSTKIDYFLADSRKPDLVQHNAYINIAKYKEFSNK